MKYFTRLLSSPSERAKFTRFILVGGGLTLLDFLIFRLFLHQGAAAESARLAASTVCLLCSYPLHKKFSFRSTLPAKATVTVYFITRALAALIVQAAFVVCHDYVGFGHNGSFWVSSVLYPVVNYLMAARIVFKK